ncbi:MAG: hypothetical protein AAB972_05170 [Patescibacteria group bacterium]
MLTTTPVPDRLAEDLRKPRITVRYTDGHGQEHKVEFEMTFLEFVPRVVGYSGSDRIVVPLKDVQSIEVDDEFTSRCNLDEHGQEEPQRLAVARWHRVSWGELLRFAPQGNA